MTALRVQVVGAMIAGCALLASPVMLQPAPRLLFNTTASAPIGFYRIDRRPPRIGDWVVVKPPSNLADWMARRGYLPINVPLLKRLAAVEGQTVCGLDGRISIDGLPVATARLSDRWGRALRPFDGCHRLVAGQVFLLTAAAPGSFDGRYFGPLSSTVIVGCATPLWLGKGR